MLNAFARDLLPGVHFAEDGPAPAGFALPVDNPSTGAVLAYVPRQGAEDARRAIAAAHAAWPAWRARPAKERARLLRDWFDLIAGREQDLARLITAEQGKPLAEALGEIRYAAGFVDWFAEEGRRVYGDVIPASAPGQSILVFKQPVGVCAAVTPWNFPAAMLTRKAAPALAAGCPIVVKPASSTPLTALALAELARRAGIPAELFPVVCGPAAEIGAELTSNPLVRKLTFTGSTDVGRRLMSECGPTLKKLSLELGGNAPFIVFADADLETAVQAAMVSKFRNMGQTCVASNRFYVQAELYEAFAGRLREAVARLTVGDGFDPGVEQGPLISEAAVEVVEAHIADALARGARLLAGGRRHPRGGRFFEPTLLVDVPPDARLVREETFGPVAALLPFDREDEALAQANATEYGLAAYICTRDLGRALRVAQALEFGMVGINTGLISNEAAPFGGMKQSGFGREGSKYGIEDYVEIKYLCVNT